MPRYAMFMIPGPHAYNDDVPLDPAMFEEMNAYNQQLEKAGVMLSGEGLHGPDEAVQVKFDADRKGTIFDGPFAEAKELVGGFWMLQVKDHAEAVEWASRVPGSPGDIVELRRVQEVEDWPEDVQAVLKDADRA